MAGGAGLPPDFQKDRAGLTGCDNRVERNSRNEE